MRNKYNRVIIAVYLTCCMLTGYAQNFGGNPPSVKWRQIDTDTVKIIFPSGQEAAAKRAVAAMHALQKTNATGIGPKIHKASIVLQPASIISNGYVGLAPWRSEWYMTAPQNAFQLGAFDWVDNLAVHEFRHIQQYSNFNKGLSKLASVFLGEEGQALFNAMSVPDWFFEGDAVQMETQYTEQGRGRLPLFMNGYRSLSDAGKNFGYMKLRNGSLRHYIPNHYQLGYLLVAYGRKIYGDTIWKQVTSDAAAFKSPVYPFQSAFKRNTGQSFGQFVKEAQSFYQQQWKSTSMPDPEWITQKSDKRIIDYKYPYRAEGNTIIALKSASDQIPAFYQMNGKQEKKIAVRGIADDDYFSYNNGKIIYTIFQPDARWGNKEYHALYVLDVQSGRKQKILSGARLFTPDISHNGKEWTAVEANEQGKYALVRGTVDQPGYDTLAVSEYVLSYPKFSAKDDQIFVLSRKRNGEMAMLGFARTGEEKEWVPYTGRVLGFPQVQGDTVVFSATDGNTDAVHALLLNTGKELKLAASNMGIYQGFMQGSEVVGSVFTAYGHRLAKFKAEWKSIEIPSRLTTLYGVGGEKKRILLQYLPERNDSILPYRRNTRLLNIHSWRPLYEAPEYSFTVYGQNVLNTFRSEIAYTYNENEQSHKLGYTGIYGARFLQPVFGMNQIWNRTGRLNATTIVHWNEMDVFAGLRLPLQSVSGKWFRNFVTQASIHSDQVQWTGIGKQLFSNTNNQYGQLQASYITQTQRAIQHIFPRLAIAANVRYRQLFANAREYQFFSGLSVYLPGLAANHHLVINGAYQTRDTLSGIMFSNEFAFSRGYDEVNFPRMGKIGVNYHFPIVYPDGGFAQLVYFQRIRGNVFFDHTITKSIRTGNRFHFNTIGGECYFDTKWWNQQPVSFGIRYNYLFQASISRSAGSSFWEFILPVSLF